jgi:WD40 repeat protein/basic membrane lipoprotein Med (substrate-binding protein (PBP1-ABC) superfamily)/DNA-binding SARP family transcriptional activator
MLRVYVLGQFKVETNSMPVDIPSRPAQSLLAFLILNSGIKQRREKLAGLFWPDASEANARGYLRQALWRIRKAFEEASAQWQDYFQIDEISVSFNTQADCWLDAALILKRREAAAWEIPELVEALDLYSGELLPGFYDEWVVLERERLLAAFELKMQLLLERLVKGGAWFEVIEWAERWIALGGAPEPAFRALMLAHAATSDRAGVTAAYNRCVEKLNNELGVQPSKDLQELCERVQRGELPEEVLAVPVVPEEGEVPEASPAVGEPPYKGLDYFDVKDASLFFGREKAVARMIQRLESHPFLAVIGASGSGKSSAVRAGLIPALLSGAIGKETASRFGTDASWSCTISSPTDHPLEALAEALTREADSVGETARLIDDLLADPRILSLYLRRQNRAAEDKPGKGNQPRHLVVIDQFEELFTLCRSNAERAAFIGNLMTAASERQGIWVVIVLRADFYAQCGEYPLLREAIAEHQEYLGPMEADELRRVIEEPARLGSWEFQSGLSDLILRDTLGEPGALPLLSHALLETWHRRSGRKLRLKGYAGSGGVRGAIARTAESVYNQQLAPEQQTIARDIFLRLTELGEGTEDTRRRAEYAELITTQGDGKAVEDVLRILAEARLITLSEGSVEVAHEALIREWPALRRWLAEDRDGLRIHHHLSEAARGWEALARDPGELYRGLRLKQALEWAGEHEGSLNPLEREYLEASRAVEKAEEVEHLAQQRREIEAAQKLAEVEQQRSRTAVQHNRRLRRLSAFLAAILLLSVAAAGLAYQQWQRAEVEGRFSRSRELAAAAMSSLERDPELSLLLALESVEEIRLAGLTAPREAVEALHSAIQSSRLELLLPGNGLTNYAAVFSPDGKMLAVPDAAGWVALLDSRTGEEIYAWRAHTQGLAVAFDPEGKRLATGSRDYTLKIWRLEGRAAELDLSIDTGPVRVVTFSPDGKMIAAVDDWGFFGIWDAESGEVLLFSHIPQARLSDIRFSPDGKRLALAGLDGSLQIREVADPQADPMILKDDQESVLAAAFSGDGSLLASTGFDGEVTIWNALTSEELFTISAHSFFATSVVFSLDGSWLATGSLDGQVILWDLSTRQAVKKFNLGTGIFTIDLSRDGQRLSAAGMGGTIGIWNVGLVSEGGVFHTKSATGRLAFSPDGEGLAAGVSEEGEVRVWNPTSREELLTLGIGEAAGLNLTGETERDEGGHKKDVQSTAYSPDGQILATASMDGTVKLWNAARGEQQRNLLVDPNGVQDVVFSPDGRWLAAAGSVRLRLWETSTWTQRRSWTAGSGQTVYAVDFSPDSKKVAVGLSTGVAVIGEIGPEGLINTKEIAAHKGALFDLSFSPDGNRLATAGSDGAARVWDVKSGAEVFSLRGHHLEVMSAAYSPDGKLIATASLDGTVRLWDAETGNEVLAIPGTGLAIPGTGMQGPYGLAFSPDGTTLAATAGTAVSLYLLDVEELAGVGRSRIVRNFTRAECAKFAISGSCLPGARPTPQPRPIKTNPNEKLICFLSDEGGLDRPYIRSVLEGVKDVSAREGWTELVLAPHVRLESLYLIEYASQADCELIVVMGLNAGDLERAAEGLNPEQRFILIDAPALNGLTGLWGQVYAVDQPAFLAGYLAASISKTGVIGTFGGQEMQSVIDFMEGFERGAAYYNSRYGAQVSVLGWDPQNEVGVFIGDFVDVERAELFTQNMIEQGVDVIFPVAGEIIGPAVLRAAAEHEGVLFIGVDVDYAAAFPEYGGLILTSVEKQMGESVILAGDAIERGDFTGGTHIGSLDTGEVGLSPFYQWEARIPDQIKADLEEIKAKILSGEIQTKLTK